MGDFLKEVPHAPQELKKKKQERSRERFSYLCKGKKVRCLAGTAASFWGPLLAYARHKSAPQIYSVPPPHPLHNI